MQELRRRAGEGHCPIQEHMRSVREGGRDPHVLLNEEDGEPSLVQSVDGGNHIFDDPRRQACGRLVHQQ